MIKCNHKFKENSIDGKCVFKCEICGKSIVIES